MQGSITDLKRGDFVDVRCVGMSRNGDLVTVRVPGSVALHQIQIRSESIVEIEHRPTDEAATDVVCTSFERRAR